MQAPRRPLAASCGPEGWRLWELTSLHPPAEIEHKTSHFLPFICAPGPPLPQVHSMVQKLAQFTDIRAALVVGGLSLQAQAATLREQPEIVVATPVSLPGRMGSRSQARVAESRNCARLAGLRGVGAVLGSCAGPREQAQKASGHQASKWKGARGRLWLARLLPWVSPSPLLHPPCLLMRNGSHWRSLPVGRGGLSSPGLPNSRASAALPARLPRPQGRMIDHLRNTQSVGLEDLSVLVLDEADRLLEMGFAEEVGGHGWATDCWG